MTTKTKPAVPPARALKDVAAVLARHASQSRTGPDSVSQEVVRGGTSHLKVARERFTTSSGTRRKTIEAA